MQFLLRPATLLALAVVILLSVVLALHPHLAADPHDNDFTAYWAAGRLTLDGKNPYGAEDLMRVEQTLGWELPAPLMLWNPPWILTVLIGFGSIEFVLARNVWLVLQLALTLASALLLWRFYGGSRKYEIVTVVLALLFAPLLQSMKYGQIGPLCLFGLTGFLVLQERKRDFLAGVVLSLALMKPHLVYMVWPAVLVWSIASGRWKVLLGLGIAGTVLALVPVFVNSHVYRDFLAMAKPQGEQGKLFITNQDSPTFGWQLRLFFGKEHFDLQYVPTALGMVWLAWYGWRHRRNWNWVERFPVLLLASLSTAAYGAWPADSLLLLPAVIAVAVRVVNRGKREEIVLALGVFVAITLLTLVITSGPTTESYVWIPPLYWVAYWWLMRERRDGAQPKMI